MELQARRRLETTDSLAEPEENKKKWLQKGQIVEDSEKSETGLDYLPEMVRDVRSNILASQLKGTTGFRMLLCSCSDRVLPSNDAFSLVHEVVKTGLLARFKEFLEKTKSPQLQCEATVELGYSVVCSSLKDVQRFIDCGAVQEFVKLLNSPSEEVRDIVSGIEI
ncbi:importin subunit alpha-1b-like [Punica granatum]|uniref:Importin subunit alpha-1b-like n=1 Tax=Punica granatum TaxID=22663 RepID=A0A6P8D5K8_PUNGR|nr:importin subunit alpha-1b-like [Punica granatum]